MAKTRPTEEVSLPSVGGGPRRFASALGDVSRRRRAFCGEGLKATPVPRTIRVADVLRSLANDPRPAGCRKLSGTKHDWRIRVGDYRVIYETADAPAVVRIYRIRHRKEVYR